MAALHDLSISFLVRPTLASSRSRHVHHHQNTLFSSSSSCAHAVPWYHPRPSRLCFSVKAMEVSGPGSVDSSLMVSMQDKLKEQLKTEEVIVKDAYGDGRHVSIDVVSLEFEGKSSVNRQRMVYKAIWEELQTTIHAVDNMRTRTPAEAAEEKSKQAS